MHFPSMDTRWQPFLDVSSLEIYVTYCACAYEEVSIAPRITFLLAFQFWHMRGKKAKT